MAVVTAMFLWHRRGHSWAATRAELGRGFLRAHFWPLAVPNWLFWIPMVTIVYAFPLPLQFLLFVLALAAWSLILVVVAGGGARAAESGTLDA
jgi:hypothetical protein